MNILSPQKLQAYIQEHHDENYAIVDVRSPDEFRREHVEGSINIPLDTVLTHAETLQNFNHIFLYCQRGNRSGQACIKLHGANIPHSTSIEGGISEMKHAGFHIVQGKGPLPLMRQVLLGAGTIVVTGIILSYVTSPWFILLSLGAGLGLMYAGISGNCMLSSILAKMPWNQQS